MSRLRQAFSAFWWIFQWHHFARMLLIAGCGLFLLSGGFYFWARPRVSSELEEVDFANALALIRQSSPRYITFKASLDFSKKIYWTGWLPYWGNCPPNKVQPLPSIGAPAAELQKLLGCRVTVAAGRRAAIHRIGRNAGIDTTQPQEYVAFAQLGFLKGQIWAQSSGLRGAREEQEWLSRTEAAGILKTYEQALMGLPEGFSRTMNLGDLLPKPGEFVIDERISDFYSDAALLDWSSYYWTPVAGSRNAIFVRVKSGSEEDFRHSITGVLQPLTRSDRTTRSRMFDHFNVVTMEPLPEQFGIIQYRTPAEYNDAERGAAWPFILAGVLVTAAALFGLALYFAAPRLIFDVWKSTARRQR